MERAWRVVLWACLLLLCAAPAAAADSAPAAGPPVDLVGSWHVLVHYKDAHSTHPDAKRWEDRIWVFEHEGQKLRWTDYPIVVFKDKTGRFVKLSTNRASRVLGYWEPNQGQLAQIQSGLEINSRGSVSKTLHQAKDGGWTSGNGSSPGFTSARYITYETTWTIQDPARPRFVLRDVLGSATTDNVEGRTLYETTAVEQDGNFLRGTFDRDGVRKGTFEMRRSGATRHVKARSVSEGEGAYRALFGEAGRQIYAGELPGGGSEKALRQSIDSGQFTAEDRARLEKQFEDWLRKQYETQGNDARAYEPQIKSLARKMVHQVVDEKKSIEEVGKMLEDGRLRP